MNILLTWLVFMLLFLAVRHMLGAKSRSAARSKDETSETPLIGAEMLANFQQRVMPVLAVAGHQTRADGVFFEGRLRTDPENALSKLTRALAADKLRQFLRRATAPVR